MIPKQHISFSSDELTHFVKIAGIVCIGLLSLFLLVKTINEAKTYSTIGEQTGMQQNTITVTGKSDMDVKPDLTTFTWSVDTTGKTIEESQSKAAAIANKALAYLREKGIPDADLKATGLSTNTKYETKNVPCVLETKASASARPVAAPAVDTMMAVSPSPMVMPVSIQNCGGVQSVPSGYETYESVVVKVRNIAANPSKAGELIAGLSTIGAKVSNPVSTIDNEDAFKAQVRGEAIAKARQQAAVLARQLGVRLGTVVSFNENPGYAYPMAYDMMARGAALESKAVTPDLPTGTNSISSEVTITYQIK